MKRYDIPKRALALTLSVIMAAACAAPAAAAPISDGVTPAYDEAYYAALDYYGNLLEGSVVKSYALNGASSITDYGEYDQVLNLTDSTPILMERGRTTFQFSKAPAHFYFEGKTKQPFQELPWTVTLRYTLNGVPVKAEELAGKTGVVEISLDLIPNPQASGYARSNYTLEAMALFNEDDILSLEAPGAQVQLVGNLRTVLFLCLPGEERHFTIRVGSEDFSFSGLTVLMAPATLAQLEEISKLSQRKDDLEEDYRNLSGSLDALLDAMYEIQDGLYASARGLDQLDLARGTISSGKGLLYDEAGVLREDLSAIAALLEPVEQRTLILSQTITSSKALLGDMTDTTVSLRTQLNDLEKALLGLESGAGDVRQVIRGLADMKSSLRSLQRALGDSHVGGSSSGDRNTPKLQEQVDKVKAAGSIYSIEDEGQFLNQMLALQGKSQEEIAGINQLLSIPAGQVPEGMEQAWQAAQTAKAGMEALHKQSFQTFCDTLLKQQNPSMSDSERAAQAKQMSDLWTVYNSGPAKPSSGAGSTAEQPPAATEPSAPEEGAPEGEGEDEPQSPAEEQPDEQPEEAGESDLPEQEEPEEAGESGLPEQKEPEAETETPLGGLVAASLLRPGMGLMSGALISGSIDLDGAELPSAGSAPVSDAASAPEQIADTSPDSGGDQPSGGPSSDSGQTVGGAAVDLIVGGLDQAMSAANDRINAIQSELNSTINRITRPTGRVVGELADLCDDVEDLVDLADSAEDLTAALRQSSEKIRSILDGVDSLRGTLDEYEPVLQEGVANVGSLSTSAAGTLRDLEVLLADTESLMKTSGGQLDAGTRQSLRGLAATLRQTAKAMEATGDVKQAKLTINDIIEDTWHEYTGDINNILLMDAEAETVSLTDSRNPAPSSVQVLIRTQEIKVEEPDGPAEAEAAQTETTFWGRVAQMFKDFWNAVTGIFR